MSAEQYSQNGATLPMNNAETNSGNSNEHSETPLNSSGNPLDDIAALLTGQEPQDDEQDENQDGQTPEPQDNNGSADAAGQDGREEGEQDGEEEAGDGQRQRELTNIAEAAKAIGTSPRKMYDLEVPMGPGQEPVTIGELKQAYRQSDEVQREFAQREQEITSREVQAAQVQQDLAYLQEEILAKTPPERIRQLQERQEAQLRIEGNLLQQKLPEFRDQHYFNNWREDAVAYTAKFGFKPHELVINDHRLVHILHHAMMLEKKLERLASFKPKHEQPPKRKSKALRPGTNKANRRPRDKGQQVDAVADLLKGTI